MPNVLTLKAGRVYFLRAPSNQRIKKIRICIIQLKVIAIREQTWFCVFAISGEAEPAVKTNLMNSGVPLSYIPSLLLLFQCRNLFLNQSEFTVLIRFHCWRMIIWQPTEEVAEGAFSAKLLVTKFSCLERVYKSEFSKRVKRQPRSFDKPFSISKYRFAIANVVATDNIPIYTWIMIRLWMVERNFNKRKLRKVLTPNLGNVLPSYMSLDGTT